MNKEHRRRRLRMPNIQICGVSDPQRVEILKQNIDLAMLRLGLGGDAVTSIIPMAVESCDGKRTPMPYLRVCSTDADEIRRILDVMKRAGLAIDVEWFVLGGFVPASELV
jgi:hypothetical protein